MSQISFDMPVEYTISVQGMVNTGIKERLAGASVFIAEENGVGITVMKILVKDQSHLNGIINTLFDARYVILQIKCRVKTKLSNEVSI